MVTTNVIKGLVITEKSTKLEDNLQYTVLVDPAATKIDVRNAVETHYGVKVDSVRIINVRSKTRQIGRGREMTKRPSAKKALIFLKKGEKPIDFIKIKK